MVVDFTVCAFNHSSKKTFLSFSLRNSDSVCVGWYLRINISRVT